MPTDMFSDSPVSSPVIGLDQVAERYARRRAACAGADARRVRNEMITEMLPLAGRLSHRYGKSGEPAADIEQVARLGLIKAVDRYDPGRGSFTAFAVLSISGEIKRHFRDRTWGVHVPRRLQELAAEAGRADSALEQELNRRPTEQEIAARCKAAVHDVREARRSQAGYRPIALSTPVGQGSDQLGDLFGDVDPEVDGVADRLTVAGLIAMLPPRERRLLGLRFYSDRTQAEIGAELGISQMHVSRLLSRALAWLREGMLSDTVPPWPGGEAELNDERLGVTLEVAPSGVLTVRVAGEVDRDNVGYLRRRLIAAVGSAAQTVVIDLSQVPLLDAAGVAALLAVHESARAQGVAVGVTGLQPHVRRIAVVAGLGAMIDRATAG
jgi:RNA polymerase sigma-B factor